MASKTVARTLSRASLVLNAGRDDDDAPSRPMDDSRRLSAACWLAGLPGPGGWPAAAPAAEAVAADEAAAGVACGVAATTAESDSAAVAEAAAATSNATGAGSATASSMDFQYRMAPDSSSMTLE